MSQEPKNGSGLSVCPVCGDHYATEDAALSRITSEDICPACGVEEALGGLVVVDKDDLFKGGAA